MSVERTALVLFLFLLGAFPTSAANELAIEPDSFRMVGYLPDYRAAQFDPAAASQLTDLIVFSAEPTATGGLDLSRLKKVPWAKLRAVKTRRRVRLILCVGGWERSRHFPTVASSDVKRQEFVKAAVRTCLESRLDGLDLDWEHPQNEIEQQGYAELLADLRQAFEPHGLALSVTVAGWQRLSRTAFDAVDWIQVMAYDHPSRHSTFEAARTDVQNLIDAGAPARKVTLGLPFYGRDLLKPDRALTYGEIVAQYQPEPGVDEIDNIYFNGPETIQRKTQYALDAGLAGVMVWEVGQDAPGDQSLLSAIRAVADRFDRK